MVHVMNASCVTGGARGIIITGIIGVVIIGRPRRLILEFWLCLILETSQFRLRLIGTRVVVPV